MNYFRTITLLMMGLGVSACATVDIPTRNAPLENLPTEMAAAAPSFQLQSFEIKVPTTLKVSEANSYLPRADIVWRGDALGNRYEQVGAVFTSAVELGVGGLDGALPVTVEIEVKKFHALTEKTRYTIGGTHSLTFVMTIRDPVTGAIIRGPREIMADLEAYGGSKALQAEARGLTQKYRITQHLARVIRDEMTMADGFIAPPGGITKRVTPMSPVKAI